MNLFAENQDPSPKISKKSLDTVVAGVPQVYQTHRACRQGTLPCKKINIGHLSRYFLHSVEVVTSVIIAMRLLLSDANKTII